MRTVNGTAPAVRFYQPKQATEPPLLLQSVYLCSPVPQTLSSLSVTNNAQADVRVENFTAPKATIRSTGRGNVYIAPGPAVIDSADVTHNGNGDIQLGLIKTTTV